MKKMLQLLIGIGLIMQLTSCTYDEGDHHYHSWWHHHDVVVVHER